MTAIAHAAAPEDVGTSAEPSAPELRIVPLRQLRESPKNPRTHFDQTQLAELAASIAETGILQPLIVRPEPGFRIEPGDIMPWHVRNPHNVTLSTHETREQAERALDARRTYEIAAGHRRFRAAALAKQRSVPVIIRELSDAAFLELLTCENLGRADLTPLEEAAGFRALLDEAGYTVAAIAAKIGKSTAQVYARLKLLELSDRPKTMLADGTLSAGHAVLLARLQPEDQERIAAWYAKRQSPDYPISVRLLNQEIEGAVRTRKRTEKISAAVAKLEAGGHAVVRISTGYHAGAGVLERERYAVCDANARGAVPAVIVETMYGDERRLGATTWIRIKPKKARTKPAASGGTRNWQVERDIRDRTQALVLEQLLPQVTGLDRDLLVRVLANAMENCAQDAALAIDRVLGTTTTEGRRYSPAHEKARFQALTTADDTTVSRVALILVLEEEMFETGPHGKAIYQRFGLDRAALQQQATAELTAAQTSAKGKKRRKRVAHA